jgi:DNA primase catalytic subunit
MSKEEIKKALSNEEMTMLSNIASIVQEMMALNQGEAPVVEEEMQKQEEEEEKIEEIEKGIETTPSDASTANDKVEDIIEETQTEQSVENVNEVAKMLKDFLASTKKVEKDKTNEKIDKLTNQVEQVTKAFENVLHATGIVDQMKVVKDEEKKKSTPIMESNQQVIDFINQLQNSVKKDKTEGVKLNNSDKVRKTLGSPSVLKAMLSNRE